MSLKSFLLDRAQQRYVTGTSSKDERARNRLARLEDNLLYDQSSKAVTNSVRTALISHPAIFSTDSLEVSPTYVLDSAWSIAVLNTLGAHDELPPSAVEAAAAHSVELFTPSSRILSDTVKDIFYHIDDMLVLRSMVDEIGKRAQPSIIHELFSNASRGRVYTSDELQKLSQTQGIAHLFSQGIGRVHTRGLTDYDLAGMFEEVFPGYTRRIERAGLLQIPASSR